MWIKYAVPLVVVMAIWLYGSYKYSEGVSETTAKLQQAYAEEVAKVSKANLELVVKQKELEERYMDELLEVHENADSYIADVRTNVKRLYITTKERCVSNNEPNTEHVIRERTSEIPEDVAERLIRSREAADKAVVKLNACIDYVKNNYAHINGK